MVGTSRRQAESDWVVDVATGRVIHRPPFVGRAALDAHATLDAHNTAGGTPLTDEKQREQARKDLNPIEDIKGAIQFVKNLDPVEEVKEFLESAARLIEPSESDLRVIEPEPDVESEMEEPSEQGRASRPADADAQPDAKALNKEHRGY